jgi:hypothetical protein
MGSAHLLIVDQIHVYVIEGLLDGVVVAEPESSQSFLWREPA